MGPRHATPSESAGAAAGPWSHQGGSRHELVPWPGEPSSLRGRNRGLGCRGRPSAAETHSPPERGLPGPEGLIGDPGSYAAGSRALRPCLVHTATAQLAPRGSGARPASGRRRKPQAGAQRGPLGLGGKQRTTNSRLIACPAQPHSPREQAPARAQSRPDGLWAPRALHPHLPRPGPLLGPGRRQAALTLTAAPPEILGEEIKARLELYPEGFDFSSNTEFKTLFPLPLKGVSETALEAFSIDAASVMKPPCS